MTRNTKKTDTGFAWQSLIKSDAPQGCDLTAALLTTYDRAEARLLAETLLPEWLRISQIPGDSDEQEHKCFLFELDCKLKKLHDRIAVVSSSMREDYSKADPAAADVGSYPWIWRSIRQFTVGKTGKTGQVVQHAKLWLLHWKHPEPENGEFLEIVVSSANLTRAAFHGQIQAAWRVCLPLETKKPSNARLGAWGVLPGFLSALADSCGGSSHFKDFSDLLGRTVCPDGVSFMASVPGTHRPGTPWGAFGLRSATPSGRGAVKVSISCPYIGAWKTDSLERWCQQFESTPRHLALAWIENGHPWANSWLFPADTLKEMREAGSTLLQLKLQSGNEKQSHHFHAEHQSTDVRWSHAKVYAFQRGNSRNLLLTSANFSQAAWGQIDRSGNLTIQNFELGVCIAQAAWPLHQLREFETFSNLATHENKLIHGHCLLPWAQACWDGKHIRLECKSQKTVAGKVLSRKPPRKITHWRQSGIDLLSTQIPWTDSENLPQSVLLRCETEQLNVPIFDVRKPAARELTFPEEFSDFDVQALNDRLLLERYGGRAVTDDDSEFDALVSNDDDTSEDDNANEQMEIILGSAALDDSYAVPSFVESRLMLDIVDNWVKQVQQCSIDFIRDGLLRDGSRLMAAFERMSTAKNGLGAKLAAEEMALRLKNLGSNIRCSLSR